MLVLHHHQRAGAENRAVAAATTSSESSGRTPARGISRFFITDDNFARNSNWEAIFDRLIELRERDGLKISFLIQVDTLAHKIPDFIEKATRAGCRYAFIGLESINPDNLVQMKKSQNRITEYRKMFQAWKQAGMITYAGYHHWPGRRHAGEHQARHRDRAEGIAGRSPGIHAC